MVNRVRSPSYPALKIDEAIDRARLLFKKEGKHAALTTTVMGHWGYKPKSSGGLKAIAALKSYGLLTDEGAKDERKVKLSEAGLAIVRDEREESPERDNAIARAAMRPKILLEMWNRYGSELPSTDTVKHFLVAEREYNPSAVPDIIAAYEAAKAKHVAEAIKDFEDLEDGAEEAAPEDDEDEGSNDERDHPPAETRIKMRQDTFTLDEGIVTIQWPERLSSASYADLKDWLEIMGRKIERAVIASNDRKEDSPAD